MMKNENGITLVALVLTIIVTLILVGTGLSITFNEIDETRNNELWTELGTVRQAVVEQYQKAVSLDKTGIKKDETQLDIWIGRKVHKEEYLTDAINAILNAQGITSGAYMFTYEYDNCEYQEDFYYELTKDNLKNLGIEDSTYDYIVNYKTGEVYNLTKQKDYTGKLLYLTPVNYNNQTVTTDTESFNDWPDGFDD